MNSIKKRVEELAKDTLKAHENKYQALKEKWNGLIARYENQLREDSISMDTDSKIALGGAFSLVENAIPRLLGNKPRYQYLGRANDDGKSVDVYDEFASYQWDQANANFKIKEITRWGLACGLSGWKLGWKEEKILTKGKAKEVFGKIVSNPVMVQLADNLKIGKTIKVDEEQTISNYEIYPVKPHDLIWSVSAANIDDSRVFGHKDNRLVKELEIEGYDVKKLRAALTEQDGALKELEVNQIPEEYNPDTQRVNIAELYVKILNDKVYENYVITLAYAGGIDPVCIYFEKNQLDKQFTPMGIFRPIDRLGKFYGFGLIEPVTGVLDAEEDTLNMALEALWTDIAKPMEYNPQNILDIDSLEYKTRTLIPVRQLGASVREMNTPTPRMDSVSFVTDYLHRAKQNVSGITDFQTGSDQLKGAKTLGEIQIKTRESNLRLAEILKALETQVIEPIGKMALWFNQQFLADNKQIIYRIVGKKGEFIEKKAKFKDIEAVKDVVVLTGSSADIIQQTEIQKWSLLLDKAHIEEKTPNPVPVDKEKIWEKLLEQGMLVKDVETFIPSLAEREQAELQKGTEQIDDAKSENANPLTARVLPTDNHEVHIKLHRAEIEARQRELDNIGEQNDPRLAEELQILISHYNDHARAVGGAVPPIVDETQQAPVQGIAPGITRNVEQQRPR